MLITQIKAERIKLHRGKIWIAFFVMPVIPALFGTVNYLGNLELLTSLWHSLWTQQTLFSCYFFTPVLVGIYCAYLWRMEHMGCNWNQMLAMPVSKINMVIAKLVLACAMSALMLLWIFVLYILSGLLIGLPLASLPAALLTWFWKGLLGAFALCSVQLFLGLVFRSFAIPVGIALLGGILGLMMLAKGWGFFCPYSLLSLGMSANDTRRAVDSLALITSCTVFTALFATASAVWMKKAMTK